MTGKFICSYGAGMRIQFDTMEELKAHYKVFTTFIHKITLNYSQIGNATISKEK